MKLRNNSIVLKQQNLYVGSKTHIHKTKPMNKQNKNIDTENKNKLIDTEKILVVTREEGKCGEDEMGEGDQLCGNGW